MDYSINLYQRPNAAPQNTEVVNGILEIVKSLTGKWFTANVPEDTLRDLKIHDVFCLYKHRQMLAFLMFTSWDGFLHITLFGTRPELQGQGFGSRLIEHFFSYAGELGYKSVAVMTVPEDIKPTFGPTIRFYEKHGFKIAKRANELWESGALLLFKNL